MLKIAHHAEGEMDLARHYGQLVLTARDAELRGARPPRTVARHGGGADVISFSLWGSDPVYLDGAVVNARLARTVLPGWRCRFHVPADLAPETTAALRAEGADVAVVEDPAVPPYFWRFLVLNDPGVNRFLCRDVDSRLDAVDAAVVAEWLGSGAAFHVIRDHLLHNDPILAGMWGGHATPSIDLRAELAAYFGGRPTNKYGHDQRFLAERIWPLVRGDVCVHDRFYATPGIVSRPLPEGSAIGAGFQDPQAVALERERLGAPAAPAESVEAAGPALREFVPASWDKALHALWTRGEREAALDRIVARLNAVRGREPKDLLMQYCFYLYGIGDMQNALRAIDRVVALDPADVGALKNRAVVRHRLRDVRGACEDYERALAVQPDAEEIHDGLSHACWLLGDLDKARVHGTRSLVLKDAKVGRKPLPARVPDIAGKPAVIAFSLWGSGQRYLRGLLRNALLLPDIYPGWRARVYHDGSVPRDFVEATTGLGVEWVLMPADVPNGTKLVWRFLVASDPTVGRFMVRDCDSVINVREAAAVAEWLASDLPFHVMRDWWTHTDLILAGMWGGIAGLLPDMQTLFRAYAPRVLTSNIDQLFLGEEIWPRIADRALVHDRWFASPRARPFPGPALRLPGGHVGQDEHAAEPDLQRRLLAPWLREIPSLRD